MNWYKAKTILIVFFMITNAFLLYNIIFNSKNAFYINDEIIMYSIEILENNGIKINSEIIPRKIVSISQFEADNIITDREEFAKKIFNEDCKKISEDLYESEKGRIEYFGDRFTVTLNQDIKTTEKEFVLELFRNAGINISDYEYSDGKFLKTINKYNVFNSEITITKPEEGKTQISGVWFEKNSNEIFSGTELKPITSVLIDFISDSNRPEGEIEIVNLKLGYMVYETETYHKSIVPIPVWRLELSDGNYIYMDARASE